ncbi:MAG TPA: citrate/2-methylcitrate synthase, partial [Planctomycetia bacterium]|nr:citrate/2-methylcitrate synthase [Planctomycetia bacterium]
MPNSPAALHYDGKKLELPVMEGTEGERAVDIAELRAKTGLVTLDPSYGNTGSTTSDITFIDGDRGILRYRGYPIEALAEKSSFVEVCYLLIYGELPTVGQLDDFTQVLTQHVFIHEDVRRVIDAYPSSAHPMAILSATASSLSAFYPDALDVNRSPDPTLTIIRLLAKLPTIASFIFKKMEGKPYVYPRRKLDYCENLLHMMFNSPTENVDFDPEEVKALDLMLI